MLRHSNNISLVSLALTALVCTSCDSAWENSAQDSSTGGRTARPAVARADEAVAVAAVDKVAAADEEQAVIAKEEAACCEKPSCCDNPSSSTEQTVSSESRLDLPDVELLDQDGNRVRFYSDLVQGKVVAINFFFTTCPTICPPLTANFAALQQKMIESGLQDDFRMISISVDPVTDTPTRLKAWSEKFGAQPGWTFLTGEKHTVDQLLKKLKVFTPLKEDHSPTVLIGDESGNRWTRVYGLGSPEEMFKVAKDAIVRRRQMGRGVAVSSDPTTLQPEAESPASDSRKQAAHQYFTDVELVNQHGQTMRFYTDLIKDKTVLINCFFTECVGVCPVMNNNLQVIQNALGDRIGKDVHIISVTVDPGKDTPAQLLAYSEKYKAKAGWHFLTGDKQQVDVALGKLGFAVEQRESHSPVIIVGNDKTGLWKKLLGLAKPEQLIPLIQQVVNDHGVASNG